MTVRIDPATYRAFALDLDGVITNTAAVHAAAWKQLFDELLERRAAGRPWQPFDSDREYRAYVDGKPRRAGLRDFLAARGISIPEGGPGDRGDADTIHALAERKNDYVLERIERDGVQVYGDAVTLLRKARSLGVRTAVVTASENSGPVLAAAGITELLDARVDGREIARLGLRGKPAADSFVEAARRLGTPVARTAAFEDAIAGVQAARDGGFGLVIGVDRDDHATALRENGADHVVSSLDEIELVERR
jgi:beta-phosphoglucomutase family hydrolase